MKTLKTSFTSLFMIHLHGVGKRTEKFDPMKLLLINSNYASSVP